MLNPSNSLVCIYIISKMSNIYAGQNISSVHWDSMFSADQAMPNDCYDKWYDK